MYRAADTRRIEKLQKIIGEKRFKLRYLKNGRELRKEEYIVNELDNLA